MADAKVTPATVSGKTVLGPPNVEAPYDNERIFEYERRILENHRNRGSRYPPFSVDHMRHERSRLHEPMTDQDRFLRKQWLADMELSTKDAKGVPAIKPYNIFRRIYRAPWDVIEYALTGPFGLTGARITRTVVPRAMMVCVGLIYGYYYLRYTSKDWDSVNGLAFYGSRIPRLPGDDPEQFPEDPKKFAMYNFYNRKVLRDD